MSEINIAAPHPARPDPATADGLQCKFGRKFGPSLGLCLTLAAIAFPAAVSAQDPGAGSVATADYIADLKACRAIAEGDQRLACFDRTVGAMVAANDSGEVSIIDREEVRQTRRGLFGFTMPKGGIFGSSDNGDDDSAMLESTITDVRQLRGDTLIITIAEGSKWQMSNVPMRLRTPRVGDPVAFKRAALGSYFIRIAGQVGVKGRRIE